MCANMAFVPAAPRVLRTSTSLVVPLAAPNTTGSDVGVRARFRVHLAVLPAHRAPGVPRPLGAAGGVAIVWLRGDDLRVRDNAVLCAACADAAAVAPLFIAHGRADAAVSRALLALRTILRSRGGELYVRRMGASVSDTLRQFAQRTQARVVHTAHASDQRGQALVNGVKPSLETCGVRFVQHWDGFVRNPDKLPFALKRAPDNADDFARAVAKAPVAKPLAPPDRVRSLGAAVEAGAIGGDERGRGGEVGAWERLNAYISGKRIVVVDSSKAGRVSTSYSKLADDIRTGSLSCRNIYVEVGRRLSDTSLKRHCAELELLLRDFEKTNFVAQLDKAPV